MADQPGYGTRNEEYMASFAGRDDEGPMWALNLMKYRDVAVYADGRESTRSGLEADNEYSPIEQLMAVGARIAFMAPVVGQVRGDGTTWDRVGVVRYPTRQAIVEMGSREDFQEKHKHKDAGMDQTIVLASFPEGDVPDPSLDQLESDQRILLQVVADTDAADLAEGLDATRIARFSVEDNIIGDGRKWSEARWDIISAEAADGLIAADHEVDDGHYAVVLQPMLNALAATVAEASRA